MQNLRCRAFFAHCFAGVGTGMHIPGCYRGHRGYFPVRMFVVMTRAFSKPYNDEELHVFLEGGKLIPIFLGLRQSKCLPRGTLERKGGLLVKQGGG